MGGAVEKEIWLFNTKKTGMQGVNPFDDSSANKRTGLQTKVGGGKQGGGVGFPLPSGPFVWGRVVGEEGATPWPLWVPKTPTRPPSSTRYSSRQTLLQ